MGNYKIKNITNSLPKRNPNFNSTLELTYVENMNKKSVFLKPDHEVIMVLGSLPQNIVQLRMKKMVIVEEINAVQVNKLQAMQNVVQTQQETQPSNNHVVITKKK